MKPLQLDQLIEMARLWPNKDIPIYVDLGHGHLIPMQYGYCCQQGLVLRPVDVESPLG